METHERAEHTPGLALLEQDAFLSMELVKAIRLYSGPAYQPINTFLRQVSSLQGDHRRTMAEHPGLSFSATTRHIIRGLRKLAAIATPDEAARCHAAFGCPTRLAWYAPRTWHS